MLILKYSYLDEENSLVKTIDLESGKYGIYDLASEKEVLEPKYDFIYPFDNEKATIKNKGLLYEIDRAGNEYRENIQAIKLFNGRINAETLPLIDKGDRCPICNGRGCYTCYGCGFIPPQAKFDAD